MSRSVNLTNFSLNIERELQEQQDRADELRNGTDYLLQNAGVSARCIYLNEYVCLYHVVIELILLCQDTI